MRFLNADAKEKLLLIIRIFIRVTIPALIFYYIIWQSISFANLNREFKRKSMKREELFKKNFDLKARITTATTAEKIESLYNTQNPKLEKSFIGNRIITITLPKDKLLQEGN